MYAIVEVSGKQYKVEKGMKLFVDKLGEKDKAKIVLDKVLFFNDGKDIKVGTPYVKDVSVKAEVIESEYKDKKLIVFKYKNKTGYHKKQGHRQQYTILSIQDILKSSEKKESKEEKQDVAVTKKETTAKKETVTKSVKDEAQKKETKTTKKPVKSTASSEKKTVKKTTVKKQTKE